MTPLSHHALSHLLSDIDGMAREEKRPLTADEIAASMKEVGYDLGAIEQALGALDLEVPAYLYGA